MPSLEKSTPQPFLASRVLFDHDRALEARVLAELPERLLERADHDAGTGGLVAFERR